MTPKLHRIALSALAAIGLAAVISGAQAQEIDTIAVLVPEQGTDYGWNQQGVDATRAVGEAMGLEVISAEGLGYGDVRPTLRELAAEGADLMIAHASGYNTAAPEIAAETGVAVAIVDRPEDMVPGLVADYTLSGHAGAYMAGMLAAQLSRTGTLGIVVSGEPPSWNSQSAGFAMGATRGQSGRQPALRGNRACGLRRCGRRQAGHGIGHRGRRRHRPSARATAPPSACSRRWRRCLPPTAARCCSST